MKAQLFENLLSPKTKRYTVTIFGAESTGKTTLSKQLANFYHATWLYEFARPYLELTHEPITAHSMTAIWYGQHVLQTMAEGRIVIQDTDLFSTVGYWQLPHWQTTLGECPEALVSDALANRSDLYIITPSTIPFETDPLRFGGNKREGTDQYWIAVCQKYHLPYVILATSSPQERLNEARHIITYYRERNSLCVAL